MTLDKLPKSISASPWGCPQGGPVAAEASGELSPALLSPPMSSTPSSLATRGLPHGDFTASVRTVKTPQNLAQLGETEFLLIKHARRDGNSAKSQALVAAFQGVTASGQAVPRDMFDVIASKLDANAHDALTRIWLGRLDHPVRQSVVGRAANTYGFSETAGPSGWQKKLDKLLAAFDVNNRAHFLKHRRWVAKPDQVLVAVLVGRGAWQEAFNACRRFCGDYPEQPLNRFYDPWLYWPKVPAWADKTAKVRHAVLLHGIEVDGTALKYATAQERDDRNLVLQAVKENGLALKYASTRLQSDREVISGALQQNFEARRFATGL